MSGEARVRRTESRLVTEPEAVQLLSEYCIPYPMHGVARSVDDAVRLADGLGYPVVLKVVSPDVVHKSDAGGVVVGVGDGEEVRSAYERIWEEVRVAVPRARIEGLLLCKQAPDGFEVIVGGLVDAAFGPTVMFGLGGIFAEVHKDVAFRVAPLERKDAEDMIREIEAYPLLTGARGQHSYDLNAAADLLLSVSRLLLDHLEITELDLNPVRLYDKGLLVLDARIMASDVG
jgi:acyl-CoA synthetase (NDP forming)